MSDTFPQPLWREFYSEELTHLDHCKHLCNLVELGTDLPEFKKYVKNPKHLCIKCGRAASKKDNLCYPVKLK